MLIVDLFSPNIVVFTGPLHIPAASSWEVCGRQGSPWARQRRLWEPVSSTGQGKLGGLLDSWTEPS